MLDSWIFSGLTGSIMDSWVKYWWEIVLGFVVGVLGLFGLSGCGVNPEMTDVQAAKDVEVKMLWLDKLANLAERHNLAWQANVDVGGRPSIGETAELFLNTDTTMKVAVHANAAAARPTDFALARLTEQQLNMIIDAIMGVLNRQPKVPPSGDSEVKNVPAVPDGTATEANAANDGAHAYAIEPNEPQTVTVQRGEQPPEQITFLGGKVVGKMEGP